MACSAQQRPGPKPRQHPSPAGRRGCGRRPLNKGRDRSPGNTRARLGGEVAVGGRSTKAGTEAPATRGALPDDVIERIKRAQQRPGPKPRQHRSGSGRRTTPCARSTKAGTEAPATRCGSRPPLPAPLPLNKGRDRSPGNTARGSGRLSTWGSLNKGRDRSPGNTPRWTTPPPGFGALNKGRDRSPGNTRSPGQRRRGLQRSTKAGTEAPATRL